jgi:hypothetical protein
MGLRFAEPFCVKEGHRARPRGEQYPSKGEGGDGAVKVEPSHKYDQPNERWDGDRRVQKGRGDMPIRGEQKSSSHKAD